MPVSEEPRDAPGLTELGSRTGPRAWTYWTESRVPLRLVFVLALLLRLVFVLRAHPTRDFVFSDMQSYDFVALEILAGHINVWHAFRPIGYSLLLALVYALTDVSRTFIGVLQALMGAALAPWSAELVRAAGGGRAAAIGVGVVVATSVPLILYCGLLLTEIPSAFFLLLGLKLLMVSVREPGSAYWRLTLAGVSLGFAGAVRPNFLLVYPVVALYLVFWIRRERVRLLPAWAVLAIGLALPLCAVCAYNSLALGKPTGPSANGGLNFYLNFADVHTIQYQGRFGQYWISPVPNGFDHTRVELTDVPLYEDKHYYLRGLAYLREHPRALLSALQNFPEAAGVGRQLLWPHWPGHELLLARYALGFFAFVLLPALCMLFVLAWRGYRALRTRADAAPARVNAQALTIGALCASSALPIYLFLGDPRVRVPFDPLWMVLAALALDALVRGVWRRLRRLRSP